MLMQSSATF